MRGRDVWHPIPRRNLRTGLLFCGVVVFTPGCGFGRYNDEATLQVVSANDGLAGDGQWWPWACADGSNPSHATLPISYTVSGTCGIGGIFTLGLNGCELQGNWSILGLSNVSTNVPTPTPAAGGWEVVGTVSGGLQWTCDAEASVSGMLTLICKVGASETVACSSTLAPVPHA